MDKQTDSDMECDHSDGEQSDLEEAELKYEEEKYAEEKLCWLGDEEELKTEIYHPEKDMGDVYVTRALFNPASRVREEAKSSSSSSSSSSSASKSFSHVPYPKEEYKDTEMIFWTLQVKPKTMDPEVVQMFYSLSSIMQTQIMDDEQSAEQFSLFPNYDVPFPSLDTSQGGDFGSLADVPAPLMEREDLLTRPFIVEGRVPLFFTVFRFMVHLHDQLKYDRECNIMALVYINRITTANNMALTVRNWRLLWVVAVMVAQKVWAHKPVRSGGFCKIYPDLRKSQLARVEKTMMAMLDYNTGVPPSLYAKYYLELNQLFKGLMHTMHVSSENEVWDWEPVSDFTKALLKRKCIISEEERENFSVKKSKK